MLQFAVKSYNMNLKDFYLQTYKQNESHQQRAALYCIVQIVVITKYELQNYICLHCQLIPVAVKLVK